MSDYLFKKGDRVRGKASASDRYSITREGWEGEVRKVHNDKEFHVANFSYLKMKHFELIPTHTPITPEVGDKYRVIKELVAWDNSDPNCTTLAKDIFFKERSWSSHWRIRSHEDSNIMFALHKKCLTTEYLEPIEERSALDEALEEQIKQRQYKAPLVKEWPTFDTIEVQVYKPSTLQKLKTNTMNFIKKSLLTVDQKALIEAGYMTDGLEVTLLGQEALDFITYEAHKVELVKMAKDAVREAKEEDFKW